MLELYDRNYFDMDFGRGGNRSVTIKYRINDSSYSQNDICLGTFETAFEAIKAILNSSSSIERWKVIALKEMVSQSEFVAKLVDSCSKLPSERKRHQSKKRSRRNHEFKEKGFIMSPERMVEKYPYLEMVKIHSHLSIVWSTIVDPKNGTVC